AIAALPPDPEIVGSDPEPTAARHAGEARWRARWLERLAAVECFPALWMRHPTRDAYWKRADASEHLQRIESPVLAVSGWADAYTDTVPRLLAGLRGPRRGIVGPWAHLYPHEATPEPAIGFLQEAKRWWDRWLAGVDNGVHTEPMYRIWMQEHPRGGERDPDRARDRADDRTDDVSQAGTSS